MQGAALSMGLSSGSGHAGLCRCLCAPVCSQAEHAQAAAPRFPAAVLCTQAVVPIVPCSAVKRKTRKPLGRILLKGDTITLMQAAK